MAERRTALVTGASRGIGRAIARRLAEWYDVVAVARGEDALRELAAEIEGAGGRCRPLALDVSDAAAVERALGGLGVDVLVNNAGVGTVKPLLEMSAADWRRMMGVNLDALFHVTRALLPGMIARGGGDVVTIGSLAGRHTFAGGTGYAASKHAVIGFTESLMLEVRDRDVRVSVVMPGSVDTELRTSAPLLGETRDTAWMLRPEDVAEAVAYIVRQERHVLVSRVEIRPSITATRR